MIFRRAPYAPPIDTPRYPALYHRNILRQRDGQGLATQLTLAFLDRLDARAMTLCTATSPNLPKAGSGSSLIRSLQPCVRNSGPTIVPAGLPSAIAQKPDSGVFGQQVERPARGQTSIQPE